MKLNLHDIIIDPGSSLPFRRTLSLERLDFPGVASYTAAPVGEGVIRNAGGAVGLRGRITADMLCVCDRCAALFPFHKETELSVELATELEDQENPDYYLLESDELDLDELLENSFILDMDNRFLCREDCRGLCPGCGANRNEGECTCTQERDPRLAVLEQLLDDKE